MNEQSPHFCWLTHQLYTHNNQCVQKQLLRDGMSATSSVTSHGLLETYRPQQREESRNLTPWQYAHTEVVAQLFLSYEFPSTAGTGPRLKKPAEKFDQFKDKKRTDSVMICVCSREEASRRHGRSFTEGAQRAAHRWMRNILDPTPSLYPVAFNWPH